MANQPNPERAAIVAEWRKIAAPIVEHFHRDVDIDAGILESTPAPVVVLVVYNCGTHCAPLIPASEYPAAGEIVRILFSHGGREQLLANAGASIDYCAGESAGGHYRFYIADMIRGRIREISPSVAVETVADYRRRIRRQWERERRAA